jgi:hypothetical protein
MLRNVEVPIIYVNADLYHEALSTSVRCVQAAMPTEMWY